jgi:hypothetical protein
MNLPGMRSAIPAFGFLNRIIFGAHVPAAHQPIVVELPMLITLSAEPLAVCIMLFVFETERNPIPDEAPQLLHQLVIQFPFEKNVDRLPALEELRAIAPFGIFAIDLRDVFGVAARPARLRCAIPRDRRKYRGSHRERDSPQGLDTFGATRRATWRDTSAVSGSKSCPPIQR